MLKLFYVCYFVVIGVSTPFFGAYLRRLGLCGQSVSAILAVAPLLQLGIPLVWGWLADRSRRPILVLRVLCLGACVASLPVAFARTVPALLLLYVAQQVFAGSIGAIADSIAVEKARVEGRDYTSIRLWGSLGFVVTSLATGAVLDWRAVKGGDVLVPALITLGFALSFLASFGLVGRASRETPHLHDVAQLLRDRRFRFLLLLAGLHWLGLVPYHGFFGILTQDRGLSASTTSQAFTVGACTEVVLFVYFAKLRARFELASLFAVSFAVTALRWLIVAYARSAFLIVSVQALHALTFGVFWATSMAWVGECVPPKLRATGQVLLSTTLGLGAIVGLLSAGALYDVTGGAGTSFLLAGIIELVPLALALADRWRMKSKLVR
jgi:MFS transporter, PPP family, 3-phenylpropionic acid transporter